MDVSLYNEMMAYYDERAKEYNEYYQTSWTSQLPQAEYQKDIAEVSRMVQRFGSGPLLEIGCGAGFWFPFYQANCETITLVDQSEKMLRECAENVAKAQAMHKVSFRQMDVVKEAFQFETWQCLFSGFVFSHFPKETVLDLLRNLFRFAHSEAEIFLIDNSWNPLRAQFREKESEELRQLKNGKPFKIYKKYFTLEEMKELFDAVQVKLVESYEGNIFVAVRGKRQK